MVLGDVTSSGWQPLRALEEDCWVLCVPINVRDPASPVRSIVRSQVKQQSQSNPPPDTQSTLLVGVDDVHCPSAWGCARRFFREAVQAARVAKPWKA